MSGRSQTGVPRWLPAAAVGLLLGIVKAESIADPNVLWGIRDGRQILSSGNLPHHDQWSWTVAGKKWIPNSWGWDVVLGGLQRIGGGGALALLNILFVMLLVAAMAWRAYALGARPYAVAAAFLVVGGAVLPPWINDRPQVASYVFVALIVPAVGPALVAERHRFFRLLATLVAIQILWVNLHFFAIAGPVLIGAAGVGHVACQLRSQERPIISVREQIGRLAAAVVVAFAACAVTPYGPIVAAKTLAVRNDAVGLIVEWRPAGFGTFSQATGVLAIAAAAAACVYAYRHGRWGIAAALLVLIAGTATACRMAPATAVVALPELAAALSGVTGRAWRTTAAALTSVFTLFGVGLAALNIGSFGNLDPAGTSHDLLERLPKGCRLLNDYSLGGAAILFRPDVPVSIDSRTDLYGRRRILENRDLVAGRANALEVLRADRVTCVVVPSDAGLVAELEHAPGWRIVGRDSRRTLLLRA